MPLRKFHSAEEIPAPPPLRPLDPDNLRIALELCRLVYRLRPWRFPSGVHKHRSLTEANLRRAEWDKEDERNG